MKKNLYEIILIKGLSNKVYLNIIDVIILKELEEWNV